VFATAFASCFLSFSRALDNPTSSHAMALACLGCAAGGSLLCWYGWRGQLRFHEFGVAQPVWGGVRQLLYSEIAVVLWKRDQVLTLRPAAGAGLPAITFRTMFRKFDAEMAGMREHLCRFLAQRWAQQVRLGPLNWTTRLRFLPGGLEYRPSGLLGPGETVSVPYPLTSYRLENNQFLLFVSGQPRPVLRERVDQPNFFVGLVVLNWIYQSFQQPALPGLEASAPAPRPSLSAGPSVPGEHVQTSRLPEGVRRRLEEE
jgi:hypothetical protein